LGLELGGKGGKFMNKKTIKYSKAPKDIAKAINSAIVIQDFLPSPEELVLKEKIKKITINLSSKSLDFFKNTAKKHHVSYQQMIKEVLDKYSDYYKFKH
jgi:predicted DNA binding CopG/RHH family protein